jgi:hypothetical protein
VRLLIEKRNAIFSKAVNEYGIYHFPHGSCDALIRLVEAFSDAEDLVTLLVASARQHIPINTAGRTTDLSHIHDPENRPPIDEIVQELRQQTWYLNQIGYQRTFDVKSGSLGRPGENTLS